MIGMILTVEKDYFNNIPMLPSHTLRSLVVLDYLVEKPGLCGDEVVLFVLDKFNTHVLAPSNGRVLKFCSWTQKKTPQFAV